MGVTADERRALRLGQVGMWASSGMPVDRWCELNGVSPSTLYRWIERFRVEEPSVLGGGIERWVDATPALVRGPEPAANGCAPVVVEVGGARVSVPWDGSEGALRAVFSALLP